MDLPPLSTLVAVGDHPWSLLVIDPGPVGASTPELQLHFGRAMEARAILSLLSSRLGAYRLPVIPGRSRRRQGSDAGWQYRWHCAGDVITPALQWHVVLSSHLCHDHRVSPYHKHDRGVEATGNTLLAL